MAILPFSMKILAIMIFSDSDWLVLEPLGQRPWVASPRLWSGLRLAVATSWQLVGLRKSTSCQLVATSNCQPL
jgi:hypothetical protein